MESYEVLKEAIGKVGAKSVASDMGLSPSLIYKWCQPKDDEGSSGADNPLDRLAKVYECTGDTRIAQWMCEKMDGYFVANERQDKYKEVPLIQATQSILHEFSDLLRVVSESIENDGLITGDEAVKIRKEWEELKSITEGFVRACEDGTFDEVKA